MSAEKSPSAEALTRMTDADLAREIRYADDRKREFARRVTKAAAERDRRRV